MCQLTRFDRVWLRNRLLNRLTGRAFPAERFHGYRVYRGYQHGPALAAVIADFKPDALVVAGGAPAAFELAPLCRATGVPTYFYFHELVQVRLLTSYQQLDG